MKLRKVIRRVSADGKSTLNAVVAANIGEAGDAGPARASASQHVEIIQRNGHTEVREHHTDKES